MDKLLKPSKVEMDPHSPDAELIFKHWLQTFQRFCTAATLAQPENEQDNFDSYGLLVNYLSPNIFPYIEETDSYNRAIEILKATFIKPKKVIFPETCFSHTLTEIGRHISRISPKPSGTVKRLQV